MIQLFFFSWKNNDQTLYFKQLILYCIKKQNILGMIWLYRQQGKIMEVANEMYEYPNNN